MAGIRIRRGDAETPPSRVTTPLTREDRLPVSATFPHRPEAFGCLVHWKHQANFGRNAGGGD